LPPFFLPPFALFFAMRSSLEQWLLSCYRWPGVTTGGL